MSVFTAFKSRFLKIMAGFKKSVQTDKIGHIPMLLLLFQEKTTVEVRGVIAFTWIKRVLPTCGYLGGGKTMSFELERRLQMGVTVRGIPLLTPV
jgi:hypothetical protein